MGALKDTLVSMAVFVALLGSVAAVQTVMHEEAHAEIYRQNGCTNVSVSYGFQEVGDRLAVGETTALCSGDRDRIRSQNMMVHVVHRMVLVPTILLVFIVALLLTRPSRVERTSYYQ